jgi:hypothetical protein
VTAPATQSKASEFVAGVWLLIMDMLRMEAREALARDAEHGVTQGRDIAPESVEWYGVELNHTERFALTCKQTALELALKQLAERVEGAMIRGDSTKAQELAVEVMSVDEQLHLVDRALWELECQTENEIEATRDQLVEARAEQLRDEYLQLSASMPFNWNHPAIPEFLRAWLMRQRRRGALKAEPAYRLLCYLVVRDTVFTGVWNQPPVIEDDDLPSDNPLVSAGMPASKKEARWQALLDNQFMHPEGDRRVAREGQLSRLHADRLEAKKHGKSFHDRMDFSTGPEYHGLPSLRNLLNPDLDICSECGAPIKDNVIRETVDTAGAVAFQVVDECDCGQVPKSETFALRAEAYEAQRAMVPNKPRRRVPALVAA